MLLFDGNTDCTLFTEPGAPVSVRHAASDLQENLRRLSGKADAFPFSLEPKGIVIRTTGRGEAESYSVSVEEDSVRIEGADPLGTVYGIYAFATRILGISPSYRLTDLFPVPRERMKLQPQSFFSAPRKVRYRGLFLNDEDLLTEAVLSGNKREIDYPFYHDVMDLSVLDRVLETALRLEFNLMIPSSFVDLVNPAEEALVRAVYDRGLYVSQHHVEPLGVSFFGAEHYIRRYGKEEIVSFISNRERMEEIWRHYVRRWLPYADRVVWQLGLRGKADVAVWKSDPTCPVSMEDRGRIISEAIATQCRIIREETGKDFVSTVTLWHEGSVLYGHGLMQLPSETMVIFSDFGVDQAFGEDFYSIPREQGREYGIYYHAAYHPSGAHHAEVVHPKKMAYFYEEARRTGTLTYSILNVSNLRPLHFITEMNARILEQGSAFSPEIEMEAFDRFLFGERGSAVTELRRRFYTCFADFGDEEVQALCKCWCFFYHPYEGLDFVRNPAGDGQLCRQTKAALKGTWSPAKVLPELERSHAAFRSLSEAMQRFSGELPPGEREYFRVFLGFQTRYLELMTEWALSCAYMTDSALPLAQRKKAGEEGVEALAAIRRERAVEATGFWENWHRGDKKINVAKLQDLTLDYLKALEETK